MIKAERQDKVRQLLEEQGTVSVKEISDALGVSDMTIRRDLEELASLGEIERVHGGARSAQGRPHAMLRHEYSHSEKRTKHAEEKLQIARRAVELIEEGSTIFLGPGTTVEQMASMLPYVDVLKVSEEEMLLLTGDSNPETATKHFTELGISLVLVSMGKMGACYRCGDEFGHIPAFPVHAVDTNGAGDSFLGAILYCLRGKRREELRMMHSGELQELVTYGNAAGALTTTAYGAIPAMPDAGQIAGRLQKAAV